MQVRDHVVRVEIVLHGDVVLQRAKVIANGEDARRLNAAKHRVLLLYRCCFHLFLPVSLSRAAGSNLNDQNKKGLSKE
ncbi:hypothetical protein SDC9_142662 [bioreactor metagenome]|uniref:Uncharacterized protein n=1 Tax=bioreactor metagenome TaxID=1076179 RepID=A0A645E292_9ZZZZ